VGPKADLDGRKISSPLAIFLPTYFYSGTLRPFQHICNRYRQHRSCSQSVHRTRDIITPPHHSAFPSTSLSYTILLHLVYISLPLHFTLHRSRTAIAESLYRLSYPDSIYIYIYIYILRRFSEIFLARSYVLADTIPTKPILSMTDNIDLISFFPFSYVGRSVCAFQLLNQYIYCHEAGAKPMLFNIPHRVTF